MNVNPPISVKAHARSAREGRERGRPEPKPHFAQRVRVMRRIQPAVSVKAHARGARVKAANAAGRNQNPWLLRGFAV
jgi:hypothetical protein